MKRISLTKTKWEIKSSWNVFITQNPKRSKNIVILDLSSKRPSSQFLLSKSNVRIWFSKFVAHLCFPSYRSFLMDAQNGAVGCLLFNSVKNQSSLWATTRKTTDCAQWSMSVYARLQSVMKVRLVYGSQDASFTLMDTGSLFVNTASRGLLRLDYRMQLQCKTRCLLDHFVSVPEQCQVLPSHWRFQQCSARSQKTDDRSPSSYPPSE